MKSIFRNIQKTCYNSTNNCIWSYETEARDEGYCVHQNQLSLTFVCVTDNCNGKEMDNFPNFDVEYGRKTWAFSCQALIICLFFFKSLKKFKDVATMGIPIMIVRINCLVTNLAKKAFRNVANRQQLEFTQSIAAFQSF